MQTPPDWSSLGPIAQAVILGLSVIVATLATVVVTLYTALMKSKDQRIEDGMKHTADDAVRDALMLEALRQTREALGRLMSAELLDRQLTEIRNTLDSIRPSRGGGGTA